MTDVHKYRDGHTCVTPEKKALWAQKKALTDYMKRSNAFNYELSSNSGNSRWVNNSHNLCCWIEDLVLEDLVFRSWPLPGIGHFQALALVCMTASLSTTKCCLWGDGGRLCWSHFMAFPRLAVSDMVFPGLWYLLWCSLIS